MIPGYRIIRELGRGGMATVHLAEQESLGREVALKVLNPALAADADFAERFLREARIAGSFRHRSLLPVFDAGRAGDQLYLAMEYLPAGHAGDLRGGDPDEIRRCVVDVAAGLAYAHGKGVVHRDIKPENILRREDGSYVLADFGIARNTQATRELTGPQSAIGTPSYMSPEQWRGEAIDGRADLYSLGIVAHELLTGRTPFQGGDGWAIGLQHMNAARPRLPDALGDWQSILDGLLAVDRDARYTSAGELIAALGGKPERTPPASTPRAPQAMHPTTPLPLRPEATDWRRIAIAIAIAIALVITAIGYQSAREDRTAALPTAAAVAADDSPTLAPASTKSVAVLPFRVLSTDPNDVLFADGLSEEILASLAAISELKVPGRTSSFAWKDQPTNVRDIAKALDVAHLLEGSIRRSGTQLRITANLLASSDGRTLWTQTFDRNSDDVFAIQNEIAIAVADRLAVQIGTRALPTLARLPPSERQRYLEVIGALSSSPLPQAREHVAWLADLEARFDVGPDLYARLIHWIGHLPRMDGVYDGFAVALSREELLLSRLGARFPGSVEHTLAEALVCQTRADISNLRSDYADCLRLFRAVLARSPNEVLAAVQGAFAARALLRFDEALVLAQKAVELEPQDASARFALANVLGSMGRGDAALAAMQQLVQRFPGSVQQESHALFLAGGGHLADAVIANRACASQSRSGTCDVGLQIRLLRLLGFERQADLLRAEIATDDSWQAREMAGLEELYASRLPAPEFANTSIFAMLESLAEASAQSLPARGSEYLRARWSFINPDWHSRGIDPGALAMRAALSFVAAAQTDLGDADPARRQRELIAVREVVRAMPANSMPYPNSHFALGAEILSGDLDAAFRRLDGMADLNPLNWQYWVVSPSGREMPTAKTLRADPRFAAIWQRREALIARERAKLKQLWPEVE